MHEVTWRLHPIYEHYEISDDGRVRSVDRWLQANRPTGTVRVFRRGRELKAFAGANGYYALRLSVGQPKQLNARVHRLVCETFHGLAPGPKLEVRHLNGCKTDNRAVNLAWGTKSENALDMVRHGTCNQLHKTHCPSGHEYTQENTYKRPGRRSERLCRTCRREKNRARKMAADAQT